MKPEDIKLTDFYRIAMGETPPEFLLEVVLRTGFVFLILMVSMRLMGKRMVSQLGRSEMAALVSLAAAIGIPIQAPDRGILPGVVVALVVVVVQRQVALFARRSERFESFVYDSYASLVSDGELDLQRLKETKLSRERLFAQLRAEGIKHLGEVKRLYFEANGSFSLIRAEKGKRGLSVLPLWDKDLHHELPHAETYACFKCGHLLNEKHKCDRCGSRKVMRAIEDPVFLRTEVVH